jgi:hypothetical protein
LRPAASPAPPPLSSRFLGGFGCGAAVTVRAGDEVTTGVVAGAVATGLVTIGVVATGAVTGAVRAVEVVVLAGGLCRRVRCERVVLDRGVSSAPAVIGSEVSPIRGLESWLAA